MSTLTSSSLGGISEKPSTKLHAPPGGKSNFSLLHDDGPQPGASSIAGKTRIRDVNGATNIYKIAYNAINDKERPNYLSRSNN